VIITAPAVPAGILSRMKQRLKRCAKSVGKVVRQRNAPFPSERAANLGGPFPRQSVGGKFQKKTGLLCERRLACYLSIQNRVARGKLVDQTGFPAGRLGRKSTHGVILEDLQILRFFRRQTLKSSFA